MVARGRVRNGVVVLDDGIRLPEGQEVTVHEQTKTSTERSQSRSVLDIPTVSLGRVLNPPSAEDVMLGEMLDGRPCHMDSTLAAEVTEHAEHVNARAALARLLGAGDLFAIAPQVLANSSIL